MTWNQAICETCWNERNPDRQAHRLIPDVAEEETCSYCGKSTRHGIYVRDEPATVSYPRARAEDGVS
jgi:hypothetical protein